MRVVRNITLVVFSLVLAACSDDATGPDGFDTEELTTELAIAPGHFHIWETTGMFTVSVTDPDGDAVTDFEVIQLERTLEGEDDWSAIELARDGDFYEASYVFDTSGDWELRVMGQRPSDDEMKELYVAPTTLEVVRAHGTAGGYSVSFETFPGHMHRNDSPTFVWWFEVAGAQASPFETPPDVAPTMSVVCDGGTIDSDLTEVEPGQWQASFELLHIGDCEAQVHYLGTEAGEHTYSVPIHISEAHG